LVFDESDYRTVKIYNKLNIESVSFDDNKRDFERFSLYRKFIITD